MGDFQIMGKRKGGAEKLREKKKKLMASEAEKCSKLTDMFTKKVSQEMSSEGHAGIEKGEKQADNGPTEHQANHIHEDNNSQGEADDDHGDIREKSGHDDVHSEEEIRNEPETCQTNTDLRFERPKPCDRGPFFAWHPIQPVEDKCLKFPPNKVFKRKNGSKRMWLSYNDTKEALYCTVCLAYAKDTENAFTEGMSDWKHVHQRIQEHEKSKQHNACAEAHLLNLNHKGIEDLLFAEQRQVKRDQVRTNRQVMERVIDIVKLIGKRGLSYRGSKTEAASSLEDYLLDHGNFLELVKLLSKYDPLLQRHLDKVIKKSKQNSTKGKKGKKGRGSKLTFLSKTTVNSVIHSIASLMKEKISDEVNKAGMFSVQLDTTQDISVKDQCSVILRYIDQQNEIQERLLAVVVASDTSGKGFLELLKTTLEKYNIDIQHCIGNATDGAANMQGVYNGFAAHLNKESPSQIHVWCYSHVLNLVIRDSTSAVIAASSLFSLLNGLATFFRESHKRMSIFEEVTGKQVRQRLQTIGETRWWAKDAALSKVFGSGTTFDKCLYVDVLLSLQAIEESTSTSAELRAKARSYKESLLKFETIMTAFLFLKIFQITSPLSKYLQSEGMDLLKAHQLVMGTLGSLAEIQRDVDGVHSSANQFIEWATSELESRGDESLVIEDSFPEKRIRKRKRMPGELAADEPLTSPAKEFEVEIFNKIMDTTVESIRSRFQQNADVMLDLACLSPLQFDTISKSGIPEGSMTKLCKALQKFDEEITPDKLRSELLHLAVSWDRLKVTLSDEYVKLKQDVDYHDTDGQQGEDNDEIDTEVLLDSKMPPTVSKRCMKCAVCVYHTLAQYGMFSEAFANIGLAYKYLLTLSTTQVACERSFSTLKFIKNRLRSTLSSDNLDAFMLMAIEKDILSNLSVDSIIDHVSLKSSLMRSELHDF